MTTTLPKEALQLRSLITPEGVVRITLEPVPVPQPAADEVLIRVEATPVNPSDIGNLFGPADLGTVRSAEVGGRTVLEAQVPPAAMPGVAGRVGQAMPVGNEGAGTVVAAGGSPAAQALLGRTVAVLAGGMYAQYRAAKAADGLLLPDGTPAAAGASCFVNPLTALGMVQTMQREGHRALTHTAAASNLGQMLNRLCLADGIGLVNVVRKPGQAALLRAQGAQHVCDSSAADFAQALADACAATGATIAFDAVGGGTLASQLLTGMEAALLRSATEYSRYGTSTLKQVYLYGTLDPGPTEVRRNFGFHWSLGGWLLFGFLQRIGPAAVSALKARVAAELTTTFASRYSGTISLAQMLDPAVVKRFAARATGEKLLVEPQR
ncbi:MAG: zinc-binding dehydrogenase [Rubrivivax sp.]|nr:zinc-binding dehydrogenase [Rubrivivax sp.]